MSERDLKRVEVLTDVLAGRRTVESAAAVLNLGIRQTFDCWQDMKKVAAAR